MGYFNEKQEEVIQDYSKSDKTLITIVPKTTRISNYKKYRERKTFCR